jgi:hypothetical protein
MGCTAWSWSRSRRVNNVGPTWAMILKGPRFFSDNFLEGQVVRKWAALTKTLSPTLKSSARVLLASVGP